ncbi:DUF2993 domain-containing protein [Streptomyces sp. CS131]|uniref:LmeA family phospholipid-binding protein n=1 Tax=Streptomyces sp. CS131 TaxID=2162711 RepID=UPI000D523F3C|nr:DUF2993 domain-containing protein [Streptomyces sp. CS131]PVC90108.1 DUF2993 domain-containing protein [Streptomyces sp. CS131]
MRIAVIVMCAVTGLSVAGDRVLTRIAESRTAEAFQAGMDTPERPSVRFGGFPLTAQLVSGTLKQVDITAQDIPGGEGPHAVSVSRLSLHATGLNFADAEELRAGAVEAAVALSYADLSKAIGFEFTQGPKPGQLTASVPLPLDHRVKVTATLAVTTDNHIAFRDFEVTDLPLNNIASALLTKVFEEPIKVDDLPSGLDLRTVGTTAEGLEIRASGRSVVFRPETAGP